MDKLSPDLPGNLAGLAFGTGTEPMIDYGDMLKFLADNPPDGPVERRVHASMLELIASCMREDVPDYSERLAQLRARYGEPESEFQRHH